MRGSRIPVDPDFERLMRRPVGGPRTERVPPVVIGALGRILGAVGGIFWPSPLGSGEPTPAEVREMERAAARQPPPPPLPPPSVLEEVALPPLERRSPLPLPAPGPVGPPTPAPTTPRSQTTTPARPSTQGIGAPEVFEPFVDFTRFLRRAPRARARARPRALPSPLAPPLPSIETFAPPAPPSSSTPALPSPLTPFETTVLPSPRTATGRASPPRGQDPCRCTTTRKPRRKCLERAPVEFSAGRYKGRPAGTRCVRFQT